MQCGRHAPARAVSRRSVLTTGATATAGVWIAPSVLTLDRVAAAVGSCGVKPPQVDFSRWAGTLLPANFTSDDGTVDIGFQQFDPDNVQDGFWNGRVYSQRLNSLDNPVVTGMSNAINGDEVALEFTFSTPVPLSFFLVAVTASDRPNNAWEDTVQVNGYLGPTGPLSPASMTVGGAQTQIAPDTVRGDRSTNGKGGNVEVDFQQPIDRLVIRHRDDTTRTDFQWIGVHDFHWC